MRRILPRIKAPHQALSFRVINEDEFKKALIIFYEQGSIFTLKKVFLEQLIFAYDTYFK